MEKMKFYVVFRERACVDPNESAAMMRHRLRSLDYQQQLLDQGHLVYAFRSSEDPSRGVMMFQVERMDQLDVFLKNDPLWPYCVVDTTPVLGTEHMTREIESYLGERILSEADYAALSWEPRPIQPDGEYWLAWKIVPPFSPLMSEEAQNDVYRRTAVSQRAHQSPYEFNDENPVGKSVGILVFEGPYDEMLEHVTHCDVYRDSEIEFTSLDTLPRAKRKTIETLRRRGWDVAGVPDAACAA